MNWVSVAQIANLYPDQASQLYKNSSKIINNFDFVLLVYFFIIANMLLKVLGDLMLSTKLINFSLSCKLHHELSKILAVITIVYGCLGTQPTNWYSVLWYSLVIFSFAEICKVKYSGYSLYILWFNYWFSNHLCLVIMHIG